MRSEAAIEIILEAFNLFNNVNYSGVNNMIGAARLETAYVKGRRDISANQSLGFTAAYPARQLQLGLRFKF